MFFQREIERYRETLIRDFSNAEISAILKQWTTDLKSRNIAGTFIVPLAYLIGGFSTDYAADQTILFSVTGAILALAIIGRIFAIIAFSEKDSKRNPIWLPLFFWSNIFCGLTWGIFAASTVLIYHDSVSVSLIIILLAGIGSGSMVTYCIWRNLSYAYLLIILLPTIVAEFYIGNIVTIPIGIAIATFLVFNLIQAKTWHEHYWLSLTNTFLLKKNSRDLERVNTKLAEEITDHKQTSKDIAVSRKKLQDIYNSAHDAIFIFDLDGAVIDVNATMLKMFQTDRLQALEFTITKHFHSPLNPGVDLEKIWQDTLSGNDQEFEWTAINQGDEETFTVQVNLRKTLWGKDSVVIATVRNISIQIQAMKATQAANRAKSEFLANISHELRTPMHGILGYANLGVKRSGTLPRVKLEEYYSIIQESGTRLMKLLNNLLDFSRLEVGKMHYSMNKNDLLPRIHQVTTELSPLADEKGIIFDIQCACNQAPVYCDQEKISQVLRNLLFNAIKFSNTESTIKIVCKKITNENGTKLQRISVSNLGIPIPEGELENIFEKFIQSSTTDTGAGGTGLGLAISKQILRDHNSTIWAENGPNDTIIFHFLLAMEPEQDQINKEKRD